MKQVRTGSTVFLCMLFAMFIFVQQTHRVAFAQDEPKAHETPSQQPEAKPEAQPSMPDKQAPDKQENAKPEQPAKQDKAAEKQEKKDEKNAKQEEKENKNQNNANGREETPAAQQSRPEGGSMPQGSTPAQAGQGGQMRPAGKGGHIPDDKFRASFGKRHTFVVNQPVVVNNQPTFQYAGYSFVLIDAWPGDWAYTDQCYIDYIDGEYFLFDLLHPGVRIALFVAM